MMRISILIVVICFCLPFFSACSRYMPIDLHSLKRYSAPYLYEKAHENMLIGQSQKALKIFNHIETYYPFGEYAEKSMLESIYIHYIKKEIALAVAMIDEFLELYPASHYADYILYLKGEAILGQTDRVLFSLLGFDSSGRDMQIFQDAYHSFHKVIVDYPSSPYVSASYEKMRYCVKQLAKSEYMLALHHYQYGNYLAAINRLEDLLRDYPQSKEEIFLGLKLLASSYKRVKDSDQVIRVKKIMKYNYNSSQ